jgi:cell wall-associated NlpC family hydrolase
MLSHDDLPGRTSPTHGLNDLQQRVQREALCGTSSLFSQYLQSSRSQLQRLPLRYLRHAFIGLSIPAALIAGTVLPARQPSTASITPVAAAYAVQSSLGVFAGDAAVAEAATDDEFVFSGSTSSLGAPLSALFAPVTVDVANLRSGPSTNYSKVGKLRQGQTVKLLGRNGGWFKVETQAGAVGWIHGDLVQVNKAAADSVSVVQVAAAAPTSGIRVGTTTEENVNLRKGPGTSEGVIAKLPKGTRLEILGQQAGWYRVATARATVGWVSAQFLAANGAPVAAAAPTPSGPIVVKVSESRVNLRKGPSTKFGSFGKMAEGTAVTVAAQSGDWLKVTSPRGTVGWVARDLVNISGEVLKQVPITKDVPALPKLQPAAPAKPAAAPAAPTISSSHDAASIALKFVGARYVYGGASPSGFDCSGLTSYVYRQLGINLPHKASMQFSERYGQRVSMGNLAPGDLVFFANTAGRGITHVALYVGDGMMVSANTPRTGVQYVSIYGKYWQNHFAGAIRPYR